MLGGIVKTLSYPWFRHHLPARDLCHHPGVFLHHWPAVPSGKVQSLPWHGSACEQLTVRASPEHRGKQGHAVAGLCYLWCCRLVSLTCAAWCSGEVDVSSFFLGRKQRFPLREQGLADNTARRHGLRVGQQGIFPSCRMCACCCFVGIFFKFLLTNSFGPVIISLKHSGRAGVPKSLSACSNCVAVVYSKIIASFYKPCSLFALV